MNRFVLYVNGRKVGTTHTHFSTKGWPVHKMREVPLVSGLKPHRTYEVVLVKVRVHEHWRRYEHWHITPAGIISVPRC